MVVPIYTLLPAINTMKNTIDNADYIIKSGNLIVIFQLVKNYRNSMSGVFNNLLVLTRLENFVIVPGQ